MVALTLNRSILSFSGKRSLPFSGTSHIAIAPSLSRKNIRISSPRRLADTKNSVQSTESPANAALTSSLLKLLAFSIFWKIWVGVSAISEALGELVGAGLGEIFSDVGAVGTDVGDGVSCGGICDAADAGAGGGTVVEVLGIGDGRWSVGRIAVASRLICRSSYQKQNAKMPAQMAQPAINTL